MFDREELIDVKTAVKLFPVLNGRPVRERTVLSWMKAGFRGHVLESKLVGNRRATSREACSRWLRAINAAEPVTA